MFSIDNGFENYPVVEVSWYGANAYAEYYGWHLPLSKLTRDIALELGLIDEDFCK